MMSWTAKIMHATFFEFFFSCVLILIMTETATVKATRSGRERRNSLDPGLTSCQSIARTLLTDRAYLDNLDQSVRRFDCRDPQLNNLLERLKSAGVHSWTMAHVHRSASYRKWRHLACVLQHRAKLCLDKFATSTTTTTTTTTTTPSTTTMTTTTTTTKSDGRRKKESKSKGEQQTSNDFLSFMIGSNGWINLNDDMWFN